MKGIKSSSLYNYKIRKFLKSLTSEELLILYQTVTAPEYIGLISVEIRKIAPNDPESLIPKHPRAFSNLWKHANSIEFLNGISDYLVKENTKKIEKEFLNH